MKLAMLLVVGGLCATAVADNLTRVRIETAGARAVAERLERSGFDVLEGSVGERSLEVVASDASLVRLRRMGLSWTVLEVGRPFEKMQKNPGDGPFPGYPNLAAINAQMSARAASFPDLCQLVDLTAMYGTPATAEGRHMMAVKITSNVGTPADKPAFLLVACHHAREIGTPVVALDTIDRLLNGYGVDPTVTGIVNGYEIWIAPVWNPDGYNYVWTTNNLWRKNRRPNGGGSFGVDQNRNYPLGWTAGCSGDTNPNSETYKGPSAGSEPETQTMMAWSADRNFCKVIDYHSYGRETLFSYLCLSYPFTSYLGQEAAAVSSASGYGGATRAPSAEGEEEEAQLAYRGSLAFLTEIGTTFQPSYSSAVSEANLVWPGTRLLMTRPIPISGHVTDAVTGQPVNAAITYTGVNFFNGETNGSHGPYGRYHVFLPAGAYTVNFSAPGYLPAQRIVTVVNGMGQVVDVALQRVCYANCDGSTAAPVLNVNDFVCFQSRFASGDPYANCDGSTTPPVLNVNDFVCYQSAFAAGCN